MCPIYYYMLIKDPGGGGGLVKDANSFNIGSPSLPNNIPGVPTHQPTNHHRHINFFYELFQRRQEFILQLS